MRLSTGRRVAAIVLALCLATGCSTAVPLGPVQTRIDQPPPLVERQVQLGDVLAERSEIARYRSLTTTRRIQWVDFSRAGIVTMEPGVLTARQEDYAYTYYFSDDVRFMEMLTGGRSRVVGGICISRKTPEDIMLFSGSVFCEHRPRQPIQVLKGFQRDPASRPFRKELIYAGRESDALMFHYRESAASEAVAPLQMTFRVALSEGAIVRFRGLEFEVIEATGRSLRYRVLSNFAAPGFDD